MAKHKSKHLPDNKYESIKRERGIGPFLTHIVRFSRFHFAASFALSCIAIYAIINALPPSFTLPINEHVAATLGLVLHSLGIPASIVNDTVSEGGLAFKIIPECTPLFTAGLFLSFVAFHPATVRQKTVGIAMGIPALYLGNLLRLVLTFIVSRSNRGIFEISHVYLGQVFTMILVVGDCILWLKWIDSEDLKQTSSMKSAWFLARFVLISGGVFLVWMKVHHWYIRFLDWFMVLGFPLFNRQVELARDTNVYYETFSIVIVISLVLAAWSVPWRRRIPLLGGGLGILFLIHLIHRIDNALIAWFNMTLMQPFDLTSLVIGQYLIPVLLFIFMIRYQKQELSLVSHSKNRI